MSTASRDMQTDVAIYVTTTKADYRLAKALIASIEALSPCRNIIVLPDDDHGEPAIFGYPVYRPTDPRVLALTGFYKKLRIFWGPAERFIHFDADQMALKNLGPLLDHVATRRAPFFVVSRSTRVQEEWDRPENRRLICTSQAGDPDLLAELDPSYDMLAHLPFNSGEFSASRDAVLHDHMLDVFERAKTIHDRHYPGEPMTSCRKGMFMGDQGFLNYYIRRWGSDVEIKWLDDLYWWGGNRESLLAEPAQPDPLRGMMIHWAGCRRPGPVPLWFSPPRAREWRTHYRAFCRSRKDWTGCIRDAGEYFLHSLKESLSRVKRRLRRR